MPRTPRRKSEGFAYVLALAAVTILSIGLAALGPHWVAESRRERESELLRIGVLYAHAIERYRAASPGTRRAYPPSMDQLLLDTRFAGTVRHLRKLYPDPLDPSRPWGIVHAADGGIAGVYSQSAEAPLRRAPAVSDLVVLPKASRYDEWKFMVKPKS